MADLKSSIGLEQTVAESTVAHRALVGSAGTQVELASPGSPRRRFFDELMSGTSLREALSIPGLDLGPDRERSSALVKAYVDERRLFEGRAGSIGVSAQAVAAARYAATRPLSHSEVLGAMQSIGGRKAQNAIHNGPQLAAIKKERARVNAGLPKASAQLAALEQAGLKGTPEHHQALQDYSNLMSVVVPTGAEDIAILKAEAIRKVTQPLPPGSEDQGLEASQLEPLDQALDQDHGIVGAVWPAEDTPDNWPDSDYRFIGWKNDADVVLDPTYEARIALEADPEHNTEFLQLQRDGIDTAEVASYYGYLRATHQGALDQPTLAAPNYDASQSPTWTPLTPEGVNVAQEDTLSDSHTLPSEPPTTQEPHLEDNLDTPSVPMTPTGNPLVITADHADFNVHTEEALRQHRAMQARVLVSLGFTAIQGGVSFMEASSRWAANPDGGATSYAFGNVMLGLNGVNTSMQTYFQSKDKKDQVFGELIKSQKEAQGAIGEGYKVKALGAVSQLEAIRPSVVALHEAEVAVLDENKALLDQHWEVYQATESTGIYREILSQAMQSGNKDLSKAAHKELTKLEKKVAAGEAYTQADFHEAAKVDGNTGILGGVLSTTGGAADRLRDVGSNAASNTGSHLAAVERNYLDAKRLGVDQEWLSTDGRQALLAKVEVALVSHPGKKDDPPPTPQQILEAYGQKWVIERSLIEDNIKLIDKRPELAASIRRHGIDAASLLESVYSHQASASSNSVRVADALRKTLATPEGAALLPAGWSRDGQRHVGVADLGNNQYAAYLVGHDQNGRATEGRVVLLNQSLDASGEPSIRLAGSVLIEKADMGSFLGGASPDKLREKLQQGLLQGLATRCAQDRAKGLGVPLGALPAAELAGAHDEAERQLAGFTALNDRSTMNSLARAITQASTEDGHQKLASGPAHASILEFPKPSHTAHLDAKARLGNMGVAVNDANHLVHRGIIQMRDLHGISPLAFLKRLDSDRKHGAARREFDATRGAFDAPHVRERAKSDLFTPRMARDSRPNDQGSVRVNPADIA